MPVSRVEIANMALLKLGQPSLMSLEDNAVNAQRASQEMEPALETVLRAYPWPFAITRVQLQRLLERPLYQFSYYYKMPQDIVRITSLNTQGEAYSLENGKIATNAISVHMKYVSKEQALTNMDMATRDVVATNLAARLCLIIIENPQVQQQLWQQYDILLAQARNTWAIEDMPQRVIEGSWIPARYGAWGDLGSEETFNPWGPDGKGVSGG